MDMAQADCKEQVHDDSIIVDRSTCIVDSVEDIKQNASDVIKIEVEHQDEVSPVTKGSSRSSVTTMWSMVPAPRPSTLCIAVTVSSILAVAGTLAYFSVGDHGKNWSYWLEHFFAQEKALADKTKEGEPVLVQYNAGQWFYFVLLCIIFVVNITIIIPALTVVVRRRCKSINTKLNRMRNLEDKPSVEAILLCFLPNECEIIEETIRHILKSVESPGAFKLWVVYNTPKDMPELEERLKAMSERDDLPHGRKLVVLRAEGSKSKAENINLVLPQLTGKYVVIYDADHHPDPESLMLMLEKMIRRGVACIQGSTYIRNLNSGVVGRVIDAEFFVTHFIYFPIMKLVTRNAVFGGSNGLWQTAVLQSTTFDHNMQCEDIDLSVRMLLEKHSIDFCPEARSGELAPVSLRALFKQRLRWAIGWDQVSLQLFSKMGGSDAKGTRKTAVSYVCYSRWFMQIVGLVAGIVTPILSLIQRVSPSHCHCGLATQLLQTCMFYCYIALGASCILEAMLQTRHRGAQSWIQVLFVALFMFLGCLYIIFQATLICFSMFKIYTGTVGGWVVTARNVQKPTELKCAAVDEEAPAPLD